MESVLMTYAGDVTPLRRGELLENDENTVLVDCRTTAEWNFVGVPDLEILEKRTVFIEWSMFPSGQPNPSSSSNCATPGSTTTRGCCSSAGRGTARSGRPKPRRLPGSRRRSNVLDGFEGGLDENDHRGNAGWRALNLPWRQS